MWTQEIAMRAGMIGLLSLTVVSLCCAQDATDPIVGLRAPVSSTKAIPIAVSISTDKKNYSPDGPIKFTMTVRNTTKDSINLLFSSGQKYDLEVRRGAKSDGELVWQWARGKMFTQMLSHVTLEAGKSLTYSDSLDPKGAGKGEKPVTLTPGTYTVVASLATMPRTARPFGTTTFTVK